MAVAQQQEMVDKVIGVPMEAEIIDIYRNSLISKLARSRPLQRVEDSGCYACRDVEAAISYFLESCRDMNGSLNYRKVEQVAQIAFADLFL